MLTKFGFRAAEFSGDGPVGPVGKIARADTDLRSAASEAATQEGIEAVGRIRGRLFNDLDADGIKDTGESYLNNRTLYIDTNNNGVRDTGELTSLTNSNGLYSFPDLQPGNYTIRQELPAWWRQTAPRETTDTYRMRDSDHGGPAYSWVDISATGTQVTLGDDAAVEVALPFAFEFWGQSKTSIFIGSNGLLSFGSAITTFANTALPTSGAPNDLIAAFWDDLRPDAGTQVDYLYDAPNNQFIVQYTNIPLYSNAASLQTFQVILKPSGVIKVQYNTMASDGSSATSGIENGDGTSGFQYSFNTAGPIHNGLAVTYAPLVEYGDPIAQQVTLGDGQLLENVNFGSRSVQATTGGVSGRLWHDWDGDGVLDANEPGLANIRVYLDANDNNLRDEGEAFTTTNAQGQYSITTVDPGNYELRLDQPKGTWENWEQTAPVEPAGTGAGAGAGGGYLKHPADLSREHVEGQVIVKFAPGGTMEANAEVSALMSSLGATVVSEAKSLGIQLWSLGKDVSISSAVSTLQASGRVLYAEPNYIVHTADVQAQAIPNDPQFGDLYGLNNTGQSGGTPDADIDAPEAWEISTGNSSVVVGVIDTGVDYTHPDLNDNIWTNPGEIAGNNIDDDNNGYVDDIHGYDFINNDGDPMDDNNHGTHVSGTIGAEGNNGVGVAGVNHDVSIMALKFLGSTGSGSTMDAVRAVEYATMMGVKITNNSWGGGGFSQALYDAIAAAGTAGALFIAAAGNDASDIDTSPSYPAGYDLDNIISVASTDRNDQLSSFSNYGDVTVDLAAPGSAILSTIAGGGYATFNGTSMATPHVAGAAALLKAIDPTLTGAEIKAILLDSVDPIAALNGVVGTGGRLNLFSAASMVGSPQIGYDVTIVAGQVLTGYQFLLTGGATPRSDRLTGKDTAETIDGLAGHDTITGGGGNDTLLGNTGNDNLRGGDGANYLSGGANNDTMGGGAGADIFDGGDGIDTVVYGAGTSGVTLGLEFGGTSGDAAGDSYVDVENVVGTAYQDVILGSEVANSISGGGQNDYLLGLAGRDTLLGGAGNDRLDGGLDGDRMEGSVGNDTYYVDNSQDAVVEAANAGVDTVYSVISLTLGANVERLVQQGTGNIRGTGNDLANIVTGNSGNNLLEGLAQNDTLIGGAGLDTLVGGAGNDSLTGGLGVDQFRFAASGSGSDRVSDFSISEDKFYLSGGLFTSLLVAGADTVLTYAGGTVRVEGISTLTLAQWNARVLTTVSGASAPSVSAAAELISAADADVSWHGAVRAALHVTHDWFY